MSTHSTVTVTTTAVKRGTIRTTLRESAWKIWKEWSGFLVDQTNWHQWFGTQLLIAVDNSSTSIYKWDADKYENLATWLYNNYVQASKIIDEETLALEHAMQSLGISGTEELDRWQAKELQYLQTLGKEDEYDVMAVAYVERLQELDEIR